MRSAIMMLTRPLSLSLLLALGLLNAAHGQAKASTTGRHRTEPKTAGVAPEVLEAEAALQKADYTAAEPLLTKAVAHDAQDYRAWFDLGFVYRATNRSHEAITAYRKSIAIKADIFESNLDLGQLLASSGEYTEGAKYLRAATQLKPQSNATENLGRAWLSLGQALDQNKEGYEEALEAFHRAAKLNPKDLELHLSAGGVLEKQNKLPEAESEYKAALEIDPKSKSALAALVNTYTRENRLEVAERTLRDYLKLEPGSASARLQMGRLLLKAGKTEEAAAQFEEGLKSDPKDFDLQRELASLYAAAKKYKEASAKYAQLVGERPRDADLRLQFGVVLMQLHAFREAEEQLIEALKLNPRLAEAYGNLAVAASENKDYVLAIRVLDARSKLAPEAPSTYFLRATAYDNLKSFKEAADNYRQFLAVADGKFPDQEWQARHRLIAIDKNAAKNSKHE